jgi:hypothetical protein
MALAGLMSSGVGSRWVRAMQHRNDHLHELYMRAMVETDPQQLMELMIERNNNLAGSSTKSIK